jgi:hypothetical protein
MQKFIKLDTIEQDEPPVTTIVEAKDMESLLNDEANDYRDDNRLDPCFGNQRAECVEIAENTIQWEPGDGGSYTIAQYWLDDEQGRAAHAEELKGYED